MTLHFFCIAVLNTITSLNANLVQQAETSSFQPSSVTFSSYYDIYNSKYYRVHVVEKGHTLYSIARAYKCTVSDIIKKSPSGDNTISVGEPLLIPLFNKKQVSSLEYYNVKDTLAKHAKQEYMQETYAEHEAVPLRCSLQIQQPKDIIDISLMLPLYTKDTSFPKKQFYFLPMLQGLLIAMEEINENIAPKINVNVFDLTENEDSWNEIKDNPKFLESDVILCAAYKNIFPRLDTFSRKNHVPLVHLHSERDSICLGNPYFIQLLPSLSTQIEILADFLVSNFNHRNFIIFTEGTVTAQKFPEAEYLYGLLEKAKNEGRFNPENIHLYSPNEVGYEKFSTLLNVKNPNVVCGFTHQEIQLANIFVPLLKNDADKANGMLINNYNISLFGPATWAYFSKIDPELFHRTSFTYFNTFATELNVRESKNFEKNFYSKYGTLPDGMAYKGYIFSKWILEALRKYNVNFISDLKNCNEYSVMGMRFNFVPLNNSVDGIDGQENSFIELVRFFK